jgi:hypothetical protein
MIDGAVVIEGVCHGVDLREENWRNPTVCPAFRDFGYFALTTAVPPDEPRWALSRERFLEGAMADPGRRRRRRLPRERQRRAR